MFPALAGLVKKVSSRPDGYRQLGNASDSESTSDTQSCAKIRRIDTVKSDAVKKAKRVHPAETTAVNDLPASDEDELDSDQDNSDRDDIGKPQDSDGDASGEVKQVTVNTDLDISDQDDLAHDGPQASAEQAGNTALLNREARHPMLTGDDKERGVAGQNVGTDVRDSSPPTAEAAPGHARRTESGKTVGGKSHSVKTVDERHLQLTQAESRPVFRWATAADTPSAGHRKPSHGE